VNPVKQDLLRIAAADLAGTATNRLVVERGPFRLLLDPDDAFPGINWATAVDPGATTADIEAMVEAFREHQRGPRLEFIAEALPGLAERLEAAGFVLEEAQPLMLVTPGSFRPFAAPQVEVRFLSADDADESLAAYIEVQARGFGFPADTSPEAIARWRNRQVAGRRHALASIAGQPVAAGGSAAYDGVAEVQGVATLPEARRRGAGATLSSALVADHFERGDLAWLSAGDDIARLTYEKIGFTVAGTRLNYLLEGEPQA
jgi:ribosomal protein S18 acetylase RimI-like enzyme